MPLKYFNCPDGVTRTTAECLDKCPRPEGRCLRLDKLYMIADDRPWSGKPSTTQLMNPTRMEYLKLTKDYAIEPKSKAYAIYGSYQHRRLEIVNKILNDFPSEMKIENETNTGTLDRLEPDELNPGKWILIDRKFWGAYSVLKIMEKGSYDRWHAALQLNDYRMKVPQDIFPISRMLWDITIRDANTRTMKQYGLDDPMPLIDADWIDDEEVASYFYQKRQALLTALDSNTLPPLCDYNERWAGKRCKGSLCPVHMFCPEGSTINKVKLER